MVVFQYGATTCTFQNDPPMGGYSIKRTWMNPQTDSSGGETFVYNKDLIFDLEILKWNIMTVADVTALVAFLNAVDGSANAFNYTDATGNIKTARIWNSDEIRSYPIQILREGIEISLLITALFLITEDSLYILETEDELLMEAG